MPPVVAGHRGRSLLLRRTERSKTRIHWQGQGGRRARGSARQRGEGACRPRTQVCKGRDPPRPRFRSGWGTSGSSRPAPAEPMGGFAPAAQRGVRPRPRPRPHVPASLLHSPSRSSAGQAKRLLGGAMARARRGSSSTQARRAPAGRAAQSHVARPPRIGPSPSRSPGAAAAAPPPPPPRGQSHSRGGGGGPIRRQLAMSQR